MKVEGNNSESSGCHVLLIASSCDECPHYHMGSPILENTLIPVNFAVPNLHECLTIENLLWPENLRPESGECHENIRRCVYYDEIMPNYVFVQDDKPNPECCNEDGSCSSFCPNPVCDNNPGPNQTPDGGPCCDGLCIECGDCGVGGEECCNSLEISSIFDALSDQPESILCETADAEVLDTFGSEAVMAWNGYAESIRFGGVYKFSLMRRSYMLDALYAIDSGVDTASAMATTRQQWAQFANLYRGVING